MAANGTNSNEDSDIADCDGEKVVTMIDVLQEQQDFEDDANAVLGASDDKNCTYSKGYVKRQAIYACLTCCTDARNDETKRAGVCLACSLNCHENHDLVELYTKRNFRCDCGNPKFNSHPCQFTSNKTELNEGNKYNHNFAGIYCVCQRPYPDPEALEEDEMIQCVVCEDWIHSAHLQSSVPPADQYAEMICKGCMEKNEFLQDYSDLAVVIDNFDVDVLSVNPEPSIVSVTTITNDKELFNDNKDLSKENGQNTDIEMNNASIELSDEKVLQDIEAVLENKSPDEQITTNEVAKSEIQLEPVNSEDIDMVENVSENSKLLENREGSTINDENKEISKVIDSSETNVHLEDVGNTNLLQNEIESSINDNNPEPEINTKSNSEVESISLQEDTTNPSEVQKNDDVLTDVENTAIDATSKEQSSKEDTTLAETGESVLDNEPEPNNKENSYNNEVMTNDSVLSKNNGENDGDNIEQDINTIQKSEEIEQVDKELLENDDGNQSNISNDIKHDESLDIQKGITIKTELETTENNEETSTSNAEQTIETAIDDKEINMDTAVERISTDNEQTSLNCNYVNGQSENYLKRKSEKDNETDAKRPKISRITGCTRPIKTKKTLRGSTFWPSNFRQKLCTCNECITMYKDLSVMFLIDPEDTVTAYEMLGQERAPSSQYERGLEALSSLDRVQQINALTEYNKMRDKLLDFLKNFKDRKEIVKEEDIKAFFAGIKPKREPDGVYFCR